MRSLVNRFMTALKCGSLRTLYMGFVCFEWQKNLMWTTRTAAKFCKRSAGKSSSSSWITTLEQRMILIINDEYGSWHELRAVIVLENLAVSHVTLPTRDQHVLILRTSMEVILFITWELSPRKNGWWLRLFMVVAKKHCHKKRSPTPTTNENPSCASNCFTEWQNNFSQWQGHWCSLLDCLFYVLSFFGAASFEVHSTRIETRCLLVVVLVDPLASSLRGSKVNSTRITGFSGRFLRSFFFRCLRASVNQLRLSSPSVSIIHVRPRIAAVALLLPLQANITNITVRALGIYLRSKSWLDGGWCFHYGSTWSFAVLQNVSENRCLTNRLTGV